MAVHALLPSTLCYHALLPQATSGHPPRQLADIHPVGKILPHFYQFSQAHSGDFPMDGPAPSGETGSGLAELDRPCPCPAPRNCRLTARRSTTWSRAVSGGSSFADWTPSPARTSPIARLDPAEGLRVGRDLRDRCRRLRGDVEPFPPGCQHPEGPRAGLERSGGGRALVPVVRRRLKSATGSPGSASSSRFGCKAEC